MGDTRWLDAREQRMWRAYLAARRSLDLGMDRQLAEQGLSSADFEVLVPLSEAADGVLRVRDLGRGIAWDRSRLSHQLRRMELRGLVERFECPTDARGTMVRLTAAGRQLLALTAPGHVAVVRRLFVDRLAADELDVLTGVFERMAADRAPCPSEDGADAQTPEMPAECPPQAI